MNCLSFKLEKAEKLISGVLLYICLRERQEIRSTIRDIRVFGFLRENFIFIHLLAIGIGGQEAVVVRMSHDLSLDRRNAAIVVAMSFHEITRRVAAVVVDGGGGGGVVVIMAVILHYQRGASTVAVIKVVIVVRRQRKK